MFVFRFVLSFLFPSINVSTSTRHEPRVGHLCFGKTRNLAGQKRYLGQKAISGTISFLCPAAISGTIWFYIVFMSRFYAPIIIIIVVVSNKKSKI